MSKLGYISQSYGKEFKISVANTYSYNIIGGTNLPSNTLIISSNIDSEGNDTGTYSLLVTDYLGTSVRLTYTIKEGNGLYYSNDNDSISLNIDNDTIVSDGNGDLSLNILPHLSDWFNVDENGNISINTIKFPDSSINEYGISSIDNETIKSDDDTIYVNTQNLRYSNNSTNEYGIAIGDGNTIISQNGYLSLNTDSFPKANNSEYGFVKGDNNTINIENGIISVNTDNLNIATDVNYGISKPDSKTIIFNENDLITINEKNLSISSDTSYGLSKIDTSTIKIESDKISMKDYPSFKNLMDKYQNQYDEYTTEINKIKEVLKSGNTLVKDKDIQLFSINESSVIEIDKPEFDEELDKMPLQYVSAKFNIMTNCDFILNIDFEEGTNESPAVDLVNVIYDDILPGLTKEEAMNPKTVYKSTEGKIKNIVVKFSAKNFRKTTGDESLVTSIRFTVSSVEDNSKRKSEKFSIVRYNSLYKEEVNVEEETTKKEYSFVVTNIEWSK